MKIRTDFVTNSSSSSYVVTLTIEDKKGNRYSTDNYYVIDEDGGDGRFYGDLKEAREKKSIKELCDYLLDGMSSDIDEEDEYDEDDEEELEEELEEDECEFDEDEYEKWKKEAERDARKDFTEKITSNIKKVRHIRKIEILTEYSAWGEFADLVADNDQTLCDLAKKYLEAEGRKKKRIKKKLIKYVKTPCEKRAAGDFGDGYEDFRYCFEPTDKNIENLAKRLGSIYGPGSVEGHTFDCINMKNGKITRYAEFVLN